MTLDCSVDEVILSIASQPAPLSALPMGGSLVSAVTIAINSDTADLPAPGAAELWRPSAAALAIRRRLVEVSDCLVIVAGWPVVVGCYLFVVGFWFLVVDC